MWRIHFFHLSKVFCCFSSTVFTYFPSGAIPFSWDYITSTCGLSHLHPPHPDFCCLSGFVQLALCVLNSLCLRMGILCQIRHRNKQDFRCVFEWASPCLVSFPSPESSKGPSIRGQAAVTASLSPCRPALGPGQGGEWCTDHRVGHRTCDPPLPPQFSPSCVGHRSPCHVLLRLLKHAPCDRRKRAWDRPVEAAGGRERGKQRDRTGLVCSASCLAAFTQFVDLLLCPHCLFLSIVLFSRSVFPILFL